MICSNFISGPTFLTVLLIVKGELTFSLNLKEYTAKQNSLVIVAPNSIKKVGVVSKDSIVSGVNFTIEFLTAIGMPKNAVELLDYFSSQFSPHWNLDRRMHRLYNYHKTAQ
jgi:hypothetical protein